MSMLVRKGTMLHRASTRRHNHHHNNNINSKNNNNNRKNSSRKRTVSPRRSTAPDAAACVTAVVGEGEKTVTVIVTAADASDAANVSSSPRTFNALVTAPVKAEKVVENFNPNVNIAHSLPTDNGCKVLLYDYNNGETSTLTSYGSFSYQLKTASEESNGVCEFICRALEIIANTVAVTVLIIGCLFLTFVMIIFGVQYLENCPKEPNIPVYLLVGGCFGFLKMASLLWRQSQSRRYDRLDYTFTDTDLEEVAPSTSSRVTHHVLTLFLLAWFALGNYWIVRIYKPKFQPLLLEPSNWCDQNVYTFAVAQCYICHVILSSFLLLVVALFMGHQLGCL